MKISERVYLQFIARIGKSEEEDGEGQIECAKPNFRVVPPRVLYAHEVEKGSRTLVE